MLFLPVPKAGCTSVLWLLAEMAGLDAEQFARSPLPEVSPALTVHDMNVWGAGRRLGDFEGAERDRVLTEDGWLRFSLVRHPGTRLWSAWQSKLLLREPRFVEELGDAPWFPRVPDDPAHVVEDFRRFVAALPGGRRRGRALGGAAPPHRAAPARPRGPRRAAGGHARRAARARRRAGLAGPAGAREPQPAEDARARLRRAGAGDHARALRGRPRRLRLRPARARRRRPRSGTSGSRRCCRCCATRSPSTRGSGSCSGSRSSAGGGCAGSRRSSRRPAPARSATRARR